MTYQRPAYEQVTIAHDGNVVTLRPTLRAAATLEARFGFSALFRGLDEGSFTVISEIIRAASLSAQDAAAFLSGSLERPLSPFFDLIVEPLGELVIMLRPHVEPRSITGSSVNQPVPLAEVYAALFEQATGWLGWTPEQAWNATPTEIDRAYSAHRVKLRAIYGSGEDDKPTEKAPDPEQAAHNVAAGLDPEFDRSGLRALKAKLAGGA